MDACACASSRCSMARRARAALALLAIAAVVGAQPMSTYVDVTADADSDPTLNDVVDVEKRFTPELSSALQVARDDALLLFTEFSARAAGELKAFDREVTALLQQLKSGMAAAPGHCSSSFEESAVQAVHSARRAATFSAENHHKYFLGHMIVMRMHLNKSEEYIKKCDQVYKECGIACETTPRVVRWRRRAALELNRVRDDIEHSRRSYEDLLTHSHRRLNHIRKRAREKIAHANDALRRCADKAHNKVPIVF